MRSVSEGVCVGQNPNRKHITGRVQGKQTDRVREPSEEHESHLGHHQRGLATAKYCPVADIQASPKGMTLESLAEDFCHMLQKQALHLGERGICCGRRRFWEQILAFSPI